VALTQKLLLMWIIFESQKDYTKSACLFLTPWPQQWEGGHKFMGLRNQQIPCLTHFLPRPSSTPSPHRLWMVLFHSVSLAFSAKQKSEQKNILLVKHI
jgi:hypothetical protein